MILTKFILYITIFSTSTLIGLSYGARYSKRVESLSGLIQCIRLLQIEVIVFANPLTIAFENIINRISDDMIQVIEIIKNDINFNKSGDIYSSFYETSNFLKNKMFLKEKDIELFLSLGKVIGRTNRENQEQQFEFILSGIDEVLLEAKNEKMKNEKMYTSLGVLMGLGIIIILI